MATQTVQVTVEQREKLGSRANRRLRRAGAIPGVIYGHKEDVLAITLPGKQLTTILEHGTHVLDLNFQDRSEKVLVKEIQYDHLGVEILHVDFTRVRLDERVQVTIPLELRGTPAGEADGGVLQQVINELEVECLVTDIPELIRHNISEMGLDSVLHVGDLKLPEGVQSLLEPDQIVATVKEVLEVEEPTAEEESAEPEVIGRESEEGDGAGEQK